MSRGRPRSTWRRVTVNPVDFLTAGGRLTMEEFASMSEDDRDAFVHAGRELMERFASAVVKVISEEFEEAAEDAQLKAMVDKAEATL